MLVASDKMLVLTEKIVLPSKITTIFRFFNHDYKIVCEFRFIHDTKNREVLLVETINDIGDHYGDYARYKVSNDCESIKITCNDLLRYLKRKNDIKNYHDYHLEIDSNEIKKFVDAMHAYIMDGKVKNAPLVLYSLKNLNEALNLYK